MRHKWRFVVIGMLVLLAQPLSLASAESGIGDGQTTYITGASGSEHQVRLNASEAAFLAAHPVIRAGVDPAFIPYEFIDEDGRYKGIAADVLSLICRNTGLQISVRVDLPWTQAYAMAQRQELDLLPAVASQRPAGPISCSPIPISPSSARSYFWTQTIPSPDLTA